MSDNIILSKSYRFAIRIVSVYKYLTETKREYIISKQLMRCGTSIGANVHEAIRGYIKADFKSKMGIALKEASETEYWLRLLYDTGFLNETEIQSINTDCAELNRILISIVKNTQAN